MKDIYDLLNDSYVDMKDYKRIKLTREEKKAVVKNIRQSAPGRRKRKAGKYVIGAAAAAMVVATTIFHEDINAMAMETVTSFMEFIHGNAKNDYVENINTVVETDGVNMDLISVSREDARIRVNYKLTFDEDISEFKTLGEDLGYKKRSVFYTDEFGRCNIFIDGKNINDILNDDTAVSKPFFYYEVNDISITDHELEQELVIYLNDKDYHQDMNIKLDYSDIIAGNKVFSGHCVVQYTLEAGKYTNDIDKSVLDINTLSLNGTGFSITGYAVTNTGLKVYARMIPGPDGEDAFPIVYFKAKDDLGNQYLYYPIYDIEDQRTMTFSIYDGPADFNNEFNDYLSKEAKSMTLALYEEQYDFDTNIRSENKLCDDFTLNLTLTE